MGTAEEVEADEDLVMAFEGDELAFETGQGTLYDTDGVARRQRRGAEGDGLGAVVEHETELTELLVGDDGRLVLSPQHQVTGSGTQGEGLTALGGGDVDKDNQGSTNCSTFLRRSL